MRVFSTPLCKEGEASHREQWPVMLVCMLIFGAAAAYFLIDSLSQALLFIFTLPLSLTCGAFALMAFLEIQQLLAKVRITPRGVTVTRPLAKNQHLTWADFQQVCICRYISGRGKGGGYSQLCFVCHGEQRSIYDRWKTHSAFHHRKLIAIDYDEELYEAVRIICPLEIADLRETSPYR